MQSIRRSQRRQRKTAKALEFIEGLNKANRVKCDKAASASSNTTTATCQGKKCALLIYACPCSRISLAVYHASVCVRFRFAISFSFLSKDCSTQVVRTSTERTKIETALYHHHRLFFSVRFNSVRRIKSPSFFDSLRKL